MKNSILKNLINKSIWVLVVVFFIGISTISGTVAVYTSSRNPIYGNISSNIPVNEIKINLYTVDPKVGPAVTINPTVINCGSNGTIGNNLPKKGSNIDYYFLGWYTYNFATAEYGNKAYKAGDIVKENDLDNNNTLRLFERYGGYIISGNINNNSGKKPIDIDDLGIQITYKNDIGKVVGVTGTKTDIVIPGSIRDENGNEVAITEILKPDGDKWDNVTSITFMEPSNITKIAKDSMEKLNKVKNITLPSSLIEIGETGLKGLANLEWVIVPASVQIMGEKAFDEVSKNAKVYCEATSQPTGWNDKWLENNKVKVYWAGEWELNANGVPVAK